MTAHNKIDPIANLLLTKLEPVSVIAIGAVKIAFFVQAGKAATKSYDVTCESSPGSSRSDQVRMLISRVNIRRSSAEPLLDSAGVRGRRDMRMPTHAAGQRLYHHGKQASELRKQGLTS